MVNYTEEETKEVERIGREINNITLNRFLKDYLELRDNLRKCKASK
jgi:hypothetical protein